jgi:DNA-binding transcriptional MerR regulator
MKIGELATATNPAVETIRFYVREGWISSQPTAARTIASTRPTDV